MTGDGQRMGVGEKLRQSSKGRLIYERKWPENGKSAKDLLDEWTSPPRLPASNKFFSSPAIAQQIARARAESEGSQSDQGYSVRDGIIHMKTSTPKSVLHVRSGSVSSENSLPPVNKSSADRRIVVLNNENDKRSLSMSPDYSRTELAIREYEDFWEKKAQAAAEYRRGVFEEKARRLELDQHEELLKLEVNEHRQWDEIRQLAEHQIHQQNQEISRNLQRLKDHHSNRKKFLDGVLKNVEVKKFQLEEEAKQQQLEAEKRFQTLAKIYTAMKKTQEDLQSAYETCQYKQHLAIKNLEDLLKKLKQKADSIMQQASPSSTTVEQINKLHQTFEQAQNALESLPALVEEANKRGEAERQEKEKQKVPVQPAVPASPTTTTVVTQPSSADVSQSRVRDPSLSEEAQVAPEEAFERYVKLQQHLSQVEASLEDLSKNPQMKQFRFDLQKSVNTPVNAISPVSGDHLRDKLLRLVKLLGGHPIEVGSKRISAKDHPQGILFCKHLLARMLVKKADEQVSSIHESAFAIAMVTVGVWAEHSDLGDLVLARFQAACPYLVPYYVPQLEGQTTEQHLQAQGYKFVNGSVEKQDKFLKRMSGLMRLYAAIMVSHPPRSQAAHPYGIEHAWTWLTNIMNMNPHPDITATLIFDLLEVTGHALYKAYNKQFQKLLHYLLTVYMAKIQAVVLSGGPVARLRNFLETCVKRGGQVPPPEGLLDRNFWYT